MRIGDDPKPTVENPAYAEMMGRLIRAYAKRVGSGDDLDLTAMLLIDTYLHEAIQAAVNGMREQGHSWQYIATGAGVTRQAAWDRWALKADA